MFTLKATRGGSGGLEQRFTNFKELQECIKTLQEAGFACTYSFQMIR